MAENGPTPCEGFTEVVPVESPNSDTAYECRRWGGDPDDPHTPTTLHLHFHKQWPNDDG